MKAINLVVEPTAIDYSLRYRFNPAKDGRCKMSRKGQIVLNRRLVNEVMGINFSKTTLKVVKKMEENGCFYGLVLKPVTEPQPERIFIARYKYSGILILNMLFFRLNLNYKQIQFSFISEPVTLECGSTGIRLLITDREYWPEVVSSETSTVKTLDVYVGLTVDPIENSHFPLIYQPTSRT